MLFARSALTAISIAIVVSQNGRVLASASDCTSLEVDFIMVEGDATLLAVEDDIRADLEKVGITVNLRALPKEDFNTAMVEGDFNLAFSETWGPPYDPHSYAASWDTPDEAYYAALKGLPAPNTQEVLAQKIDAVLETEGELARQAGWSEILSILHEQATEIPFSGKSIPAVFNARLSGYVKGLQQFDYPMHTLRVISGSQNITVSPGGQTGLFKGVGRLDPHSYRPNEFFANNWVYEGLVEYGAGGEILPSLATSWTVESEGEGQTYTFALRQGVTFHDGATWNCAAAKLNLDHVFVEPLTTGDWHGWYGLPGQLTSWTCESDYVLKMTTRSKYYPLLQELTYIRPLRMLSPNKFVGGSSSDPYTQNSCPTGWGLIETEGMQNVTCSGTTGISGTGRWEYVSTTSQEVDGETEVQSVLFKRNPNHWDSSSDTNKVEFMKLVRYADHAAVKAALLDGTLDAVVGDGVLDPEDVVLFRSAQHQDGYHVSLTAPMQNRIVIFNTAKAPTDDIKVRKTMIHAVNKAAIIDAELAGIDKPVDSLFPKNAPYCDVDLTPRWDYDFEKAQFLNCPTATESESEDSDNQFAAGGAAVGILGFLTVCLAGTVVYMRKRERDGDPVFEPLVKYDTTKTNGHEI